MRKITLKEIFIRIIILSVIFLLAAFIINGCRQSRDISVDSQQDTIGITQQTGSGGGSEAAAKADKASAGDKKNSFAESESYSQTNSGNETSNGTESSNQTSTGNETAIESANSNEIDAASESESNNESIATVDENKILFTFVISGDNGPHDNEKPQPEVFTRLVKYMKQENPVFYISTGDLIMGNTDNENVIERQFDDYLKAKSELDVLNFVAPGNHDVANNTSRKYFLKWILEPALNNAGSSGIKINASLQSNELSGFNLQETADSEVQMENTSTKTGFYYYLEYKGVYLIILNAYEKGYWGLIKNDELFWLGQLLDKLKDKPVFIFMHPPPYSVLNPDCITDGSLHVAFSSKENQEQVRALFAQFKVDGVFNGHEHLYNKQEHDGVVYIITGGSGSPLYAPADEGGFYHFLRIQVKAKSWIMDVIDSSGNKVYTEELLFN
jgi:hypothetical protein